MQSLKVVTRSMVDANLVGHDSHGIIHLPKYVHEIEESLIQPGATIEVKRESSSMAALDGNWGFGARNCDTWDEISN